MTDNLPPRTILESDDEMFRVQSQLRRAAGGEELPTIRKEQLYCPSVRSPVPILTVCDDGESNGEVIRIRAERFVIGREEGDLKLSNDEMVSARHAAIAMQQVNGKPCFVVLDLQSRNGLFVRVKRAPIADQGEVLVGSGRYRLEMGERGNKDTEDYAGLRGKTMVFGDHRSAGTESISEVVGGGVGFRLVLTKNEYWIGRSTDCEISRPNDPFAKDKHARLTRSDRGTWIVHNNQTLNGIWLRMPQVVVEPGQVCEFRIGEQRLKLAYGVRKCQ